MKSQVFSRFDPTSNERFRRSVADAAQLTEQGLLQVVQRLPDLLLAEDRDRAEAIESILVNELKTTPRLVQGALVLFTFYATKLCEPDFKLDSPKALCEDLVELQVLAPANRDKMERALAAVQQITRDKLSIEWRRSQAARGVLPCLESIDATVELRAILDAHNSSRLVSLNDYQPRIHGVVPIVSVSVMTDSSDQSYIFQCDEKQLETLIMRLEMANRDLLALKAYLQPATDDNSGGQ